MTIQPGMPRAQGSSSASADLRRLAEQEAVYADNAKFARLATLLRDLLAEQDRLLAALTAQEQETAIAKKNALTILEMKCKSDERVEKLAQELSLWRAARQTDQ